MNLTTGLITYCPPWPVAPNSPDISIMVDADCRIEWFYEVTPEGKKQVTGILMSRTYWVDAPLRIAVSKEAG